MSEWPRDCRARLYDELCKEAGFYDLCAKVDDDGRKVIALERSWSEYREELLAIIVKRFPHVDASKAPRGGCKYSYMGRENGTAPPKRVTA